MKSKMHHQFQRGCLSKNIFEHPKIQNKNTQEFFDIQKLKFLSFKFQEKI
ncbi:MAG: hypothetical protein ABIG37_02765 [Nanoarchaeota archaeon]|nr:hypothetical protein [Nanoarchaeota archaeon]